MVKPKKALAISFMSALIIGIFYWVLQSVIISIKPWMVGLITFIVAFIGMQYRSFK